MYKTILAATDGTELAQKAVDQAADLANVCKAKLVLTTVTEQVPVYDYSEFGTTMSQDVFDEIRRANGERGRKILSTAAGRLSDKPETIHIDERQASEGILEASRQCHADLIVMGSHGRRGLDRLLLGSQASKVLSLSPVPVLIVK